LSRDFLEQVWENKKKTKEKKMSKNIFNEQLFSAICYNCEWVVCVRVRVCVWVYGWVWLPLLLLVVVVASFADHRRRRRRSAALSLPLPQLPALFASAGFENSKAITTTTSA